MQAVLETSSDRYAIDQYLAEGGMGAIYLGKKLGPGGFEKEVVLKQLLPEFTSEPQFIDLFLREARITASLDHPNIVQTLDLVKTGKDFFIVMEYVRGADLRTVLKRARRRGRRLSPEAGIYLGHEIAEALAYAHGRKLPDGRSLGLIHRDVSPSNILLSETGDVKLSDFGIAKAATHRSVFYRVKGKVGYMSPEQARGEPLDGRADVYALAVCVYEAIVGERLFVGDLLSTPSMIYSQPVPRLTEQCPGVPAEIDAVVQRALSVDRAGRFESAREFADVLRKTALRHGMLYSAAEMAAHLGEICGRDGAEWVRLELADERGPTGVYPPDESAVGTPAEREDVEPPSPPPRPARRLGEGTQLTSIARLQERERQAAAEAAKDLEDAWREETSRRGPRVHADPPPETPPPGAASGGHDETPSPREPPRPALPEPPPLPPPSSAVREASAVEPAPAGGEAKRAPAERRRAVVPFHDEPTAHIDLRRTRQLARHEDTEEETRTFVPGSRRPARPHDNDATAALELPRPEPSRATMVEDLQRWLRTSTQNRILFALLVLVLILLGITLGVLLSDPGLDLEPPPARP